MWHSCTELARSDGLAWADLVTTYNMHFKRHMLFVGVFCAAAAAAPPAAAPPPADDEFGLLADLRPSPSLGVSVQPSFSWVVPAVPTLGPGQTQQAFQVRVSGPAGVSAWDSGRVASAQQSHVQCPVTLAAAAKYQWEVLVQVRDGAGATAEVNSTAATLVTALSAWDARTRPIWPALPPPAPPSPAPHPPANAEGRFIRPEGPPTGYPHGSVFYERFNDSSASFVTNCPEHPQWCGKAQQGCYGRLQVRTHATLLNDRPL